MTESLAFLIVTFVIMIAFEAVNGWTDAPNSIATVVSTRVMPPFAAVSMAAVLNLVGALSGTAVAVTVGKGVVNIDSGIGLQTVAAGCLAVVCWSGLTAYWRIPTSESHGLVAGLAGAAVQQVGFDALIWHGWQKVFSGMGLSLLFGFGAAFAIVLMVLWLFRNASPSGVRRNFGHAQIISSAFMAWSHGTSDGQKAIGAMALALALYDKTPAKDFSVPLWVILLAAVTMGVSTMAGGWRIMKTLGTGITHLETYQGFGAETAAAATLAITARFGIPVSTTHTIGSAIMGAGATRRLSAVRWGIAYNIVLAWVSTFPICFGLGYLFSAVIPS
ncbi:MAG: inorganic phosphate transporter [Dehalococcoidia bacterium]|nr:inorganic phosphate transporter [Dehalococcoidia bacterium]